MLTHSAYLKKQPLHPLMPGRVLSPRWNQRSNQPDLRAIIKKNYQALREFNSTDLGELNKHLTGLTHKLREDKKLNLYVEGSPFLSDFFRQTLNHVNHATVDNSLYSSLWALNKLNHFFTVLTGEPVSNETLCLSTQTLEEIEKKQRHLVNLVSSDPMGTYLEFAARIKRKGPETSFPELRDVLDYLEIKLLLDSKLNDYCRAHPQVNALRSIISKELSEVKLSCPYLRTLEVINSVTEFFDLYQRRVDPSRASKIFYSQRYEYQIHALTADLPAFIVLPLVIPIGASEQLRIRGTQIGFLNVVTENSWVDGHYQSPYEVLTEGWNHARKMHLASKEYAELQGYTTNEFSFQSHDFIQDFVLPLISLNKNDSVDEESHKKIMKIVMFEVFHEMSRPACPEVLESMLLKSSLEASEETHPLAKVYRKLTHHFYDFSHDQESAVNDPRFHSQESVVDAALTILEKLGRVGNREALLAQV